MNLIWIDVECVNSCTKVSFTTVPPWDSKGRSRIIRIPEIEPKYRGYIQYSGNLHLVGGDNFSSSSVDDIILYKRHFMIQADQKKMTQVFLAMFSNDSSYAI